MEPTAKPPTPRHSVSVAAAIFDECGENVLLIKRRDNGHWEPPGGVLELGETIEDGLRREVREETGVDISVGPLTGVYKNMQRGIIALVFRARATRAPFAQSPEASMVAWRPVSDVPSLLGATYAFRILDAARFTASASIRAHSGEPDHTARPLTPPVDRTET